MCTPKPEDLAVASFGTTGEQGAGAVGAGTRNPTPHTCCDGGPPAADDCR